MSLAEKLARDGWDHDEGAHRVEEVCAHNPDLADQVGRIALRFIQERGLSEEFAGLIEEIDRASTPESAPEP